MLTLSFAAGSLAQQHLLTSSGQLHHYWLHAKLKRGGIVGCWCCMPEPTTLHRRRRSPDSICIWRPSCCCLGLGGSVPGKHSSRLVNGRDRLFLSSGRWALLLVSIQLAPPGCNASAILVCGIGGKEQRGLRACMTLVLLTL